MDVASYPCQWPVRVFSSGGDSLKFLAGYNFRPLISEKRAVFLLKRWTGVRILSTSAFCNRKHTERSTKRGVFGESEVRRIPRILRTCCLTSFLCDVLRFSKCSALVPFSHAVCSRSPSDRCLARFRIYISFVREYRTIYGLNDLVPLSNNVNEEFESCSL